MQKAAFAPKRDSEALRATLSARHVGRHLLDRVLLRSYVLPWDKTFCPLFLQLQL